MKKFVLFIIWSAVIFSKYIVMLLERGGIW